MPFNGSTVQPFNDYMTTAASHANLGQTIDAIETPALLIDLDVVDRNLAAMRSQVADRPVQIRTHFKSLKCGSLAAYLAERGFENFMAAKMCEAGVLAVAFGPTRIRMVTHLDVTATDIDDALGRVDAAVAAVPA